MSESTYKQLVRSVRYLVIYGEMTAAMTRVERVEYASLQIPRAPRDMIECALDEVLP